MGYRNTMDSTKKIEMKEKEAEVGTKADKPIFVPAQGYNNGILQYYKDVSCLVFGSACGILQLHAINGLVFFVLSSVISSIIFQLSMTTFSGTNNKITDYYLKPIKEIYLGDIGRQAATFTMMWCLLNALVSY